MVKRFIQKLARKVLAPAMQQVLAENGIGKNKVQPLSPFDRKRLDEISALHKQVQYLISLQHQQMLSNGLKPDMDALQFRTFSQNGEDGLLHYIFSTIGSETKKVVEICCGNGQECNATNLIVNYGWEGLLVDGNPKNIEYARKFFASRSECKMWPPQLVQSWVTVENVNDLISSHGFEGEIDLLSLDIDGNDYWIFEAIDCISPRVVITEYQNSMGPNNAKTQKYDPEFVQQRNEEGLDLYGTSLPALAHLAKQKNYRLVARQEKCINAVFMRNDVGQDLFPEISLEDCFDHPMAQFNIRRLQDHVEAKTFNDDIWMDVA